MSEIVMTPCDRFRLLPLTQGPGRLPGAARPSPERVICPDGGLGVGTRVYVHQRSLEYDGRA